MLGLRTRDAGDLVVLGEDPATAGIGVRSPNRLRAGAPRPARRALRGRPRAPSRRDSPAPSAGLDAAGERRALVGRARRGTFPARRHDVDRPAAAGEARSGDRARPGARAPRRADRWARPDAANGDARSHPPYRLRVRDAHRRLVPPPRGGGADLRRGRDRRGRRGRARGDGSPTCAAAPRGSSSKSTSAPTSSRRSSSGGGTT